MRRLSLATLCCFALSGACSDDKAERSVLSDASIGDAAQSPAAALDAASSAVTDSQSASHPLGDAAATVRADSGSLSVRLPPANGGLDYQLGGAYAPASGVSIVSRDRHAAPAAGLYNICYVNGLQAQADEADFWLQQQPDLVLRDNANKPVIDADWNEMLLDVSTADKRTRLAAIVGGWIDGCAQAGFDAVEVDNLDSYARSGGRLQMDDAVAFVALLSDRAHRQGLAIAQKNASELVTRKAELGTDFVVAEECNRYDECAVYSSGYGEHVLMIEYQRADFQKGCSQYPSFSMVLRDVDLVTPSEAKYVFEDC
ncbi:MAG: hypothetical protein JWN04_1179 [Myxococcaceae bacterium]|nr:hypothetical protein [Myxococcaceae bacterium]